MQFGHVPGVDKKVSRLLQGTMSIDPGDKDKFFAHMDLALEHGFNTFDSALVYGEAKEKRIGEWIRDRGVRNSVVILAKGAHHDKERRRVTPEDITSDLTDILDRMQLDTVDLYVLHRDDPDYPVGPIVEVLNKYSRQGLIGGFGGSNWSHTRLEQANTYALEHGLKPFAVSSPNFSLAEQVDEPWLNCVSIGGDKGEEARAWYRDQKIVMMPWSSLAAGFFSDRIRRDNVDEIVENKQFEMTRRCYVSEDNFKRLDRARELANEKGLSVPQVALAYLLNQPFSVFPLVFCATEAEFKENVAALDIKLTAEEISWLELKQEVR